MSFSSLIYIPVQHCGFWDGVGSVGRAFFTSLKAVTYWGMGKSAKTGQQKRAEGIKYKVSGTDPSAHYGI